MDCPLAHSYTFWYIGNLGRGTINRVTESLQSPIRLEFLP
jgi:hypothetical protein